MKTSLPSPVLSLVQLSFHSNSYPLLRLSRYVQLVYPIPHLLLGELIVVQETASSEPTDGIFGGRFDRQQDVGPSLLDVPSQVHPVCVSGLVQNTYGTRGYRQDLS